MSFRKYLDKQAANVVWMRGNALTGRRKRGALFTVSSVSGMLTVAALLFAGHSASAAAPAADPQVERLSAAGHTLKWNWTPPGRAERYGHAEVLINAPLNAVRTQVTDYAHYKEFTDKFQNARMVGKEGGNVDMYFKMPIMHGMVTLWYVTRFAAPRATTPGTEVVEGKFVRGNIKDMNIVLTMRSLDPNWTVLSCDLLLLPNVAAPPAAVDEELRDAAQQAVDAIRDRAQGKKGDVPYKAAAR